MIRHKWLFTLLAALLLIGGGGLFLWRTGFFAAATSLEGIHTYIENFSPYSQVVFFLIQLTSVIIAPIPSNITAMGGALLFGTLPSFLLTWAAVTLGSVTVFLLARALGQSFVNRFVNAKVSDRYLDLIKKKRDVFLVLAFLFPFFPDDILCILAGLTDISLPRFLILVTLFRPWGLLVACALGGSVISIPPLGMVLIGLIGIAAFVFGLKYGDKVEAKLLAHIKK